MAKKTLSWLGRILLVFVLLLVIILIATLKSLDACSRDIFTIIKLEIFPEPWTGKCIQYHDHGPLRYEGQLIEGKYEGVWKYYSVEGYLSSEVNFKNGERHGAKKIFDKDGNITKTEKYIEGRLIEADDK
tara:strand:- start:116 stop:505 length:390 start_codon:yes stop_codon:yes gene_type:complete